MSDPLISIAAELAESMPEESQFAIDEHENQQRENRAIQESEAASVRQPTQGTPSGGGLATSPTGVQYNPATHEVSPKTGKVIKKRRGGGASKSVVNASSSSSSATTSQSNGTTTAQNDLVVQARATGQFAAAATVTVCVGIFGNEFQPVKNAEKDEYAYLEKAYSDYFIATGKTDLPPGIVLCIALGSYIAPRFTMPKTQSKLGAFKDWAAGKFLTWRGKKVMKDAAKAANEEKQ